MSLVSATLLTGISGALIISTVLLSKAIIDNLRAGDTDNNVKL